MILIIVYILDTFLTLWYILQVGFYPVLRHIVLVITKSTYISYSTCSILFQFMLHLLILQIWYYWLQMVGLSLGGCGLAPYTLLCEKFTTVHVIYF